MSNNDEIFCTNCGAILNDQPGFNPDVGAWTCTKCGHMMMADDVYSGEKYEGVAWFCDNCGTLLNRQYGFTDSCGSWRCTECGYVNGTTNEDIVKYKCPSCYAPLDIQYGFSDYTYDWTCTKCGANLHRDYLSGEFEELEKPKFKCPNCGSPLDNQTCFSEYINDWTCTVCGANLHRDYSDEEFEETDNNSSTEDAHSYSRSADEYNVGRDSDFADNSAYNPSYSFNDSSLSSNTQNSSKQKTKNSGSSAGGCVGSILFIVFVIYLLRSCLCDGCGSSSQDTRNAIYTEAEYTTSKQQYTKPNIETSEQYMGDIKFLAPSSWYYKTSQGYKYYYVDENDTNVFLMAYYQETEPNNPSKSEFESSYMDGVVNGYTKEMQSVSIISREVEQKGDFYIGIVNLKADFVEKYREMLVCIVFDCQTGVVYAFTFLEPENTSEENRAIFYYVIDSIEKEF